MNKHVFISYSSKDEEIAFKICSIIEKNGINCWIAPRNVRPGFSYDEEIVEGIENTKAIIILLSANSNDSDHVKRELELAINQGLRIYPVRIQNINVGKKLKFFLAGKQWIDVFQTPFEEKLKVLIKVISESIELKGSSGSIDKNVSDNIAIKQIIEEIPVPLQTIEEVNREPKTDVIFENFTDKRDGHVYKTVRIGKQLWMAENLNYKTNNSVIYRNAPKNGEIYGRLYQWNDIFDACPEGWRIPNDLDWYKLINFVGASEKIGKKFKVSGTDFWKHPYTGDDNRFGFSALPGGMCVDKTFGWMGASAYFWSYDEYDKTHAWRWSFFKDELQRLCEDKEIYFSVRCIKKDN